MLALIHRRGGPSALVTLPEESVWELDALPAAQMLKLLGAQLGVERIKPCVNCGGVFGGDFRPTLPSPQGMLNTA
jgi:hypothetical protein